MASTGPVVAAGVVYVGTESGWFYALDRQTGDELWVLGPTADMGMLESPSVSDRHPVCGVLRGLPAVA